MRFDLRSSKEICLIFDLDGTLVDSESINAKALIALYEKLPITVEELVCDYRGWKLATIVADIEKRFGEIARPGAQDRYHAAVEALFTTDLRAFDGVKTALQALTYPKCVASSAPKSKIETALHAVGLLEVFGPHLFSSYEVGHWKPDPRLFLHAAERMGYAPENCFVIEDSFVGIQAAEAAGMTPFLFGTAHAYHASRLNFQNYSDLQSMLEAEISRRSR